jgi:hypothetical protein
MATCELLGIRERDDIWRVFGAVFADLMQCMLERSETANIWKPSVNPRRRNRLHIHLHISMGAFYGL